MTKEKRVEKKETPAFVDGVHKCKELVSENKRLAADNEGTVIIFDSESDGVFLWVGSNYVKITYCPFCGKKLESK